MEKIVTLKSGVTVFGSFHKDAVTGLATDGKKSEVISALRKDLSDPVYGETAEALLFLINTIGISEL